MKKFMVVGCGKIAGAEGVSLITHASAINSTPGAKLVACVDINHGKAKKFAKLYGCRPYQNLEKAIDENRVDVISICTPDNTHYKIAKKIITSPRRPSIIFLEKPVCRTIIEYEELCDLASRYKVVIAVNTTRRVSKKYEELKKFFTENKFGEISQIKVTYYSGWYHNGWHAIDLLCFLFGDTINWDKVDSIIPSPYPNDPTIEITGHFVRKGSKIDISSIDESLFQLFEVDVWCEKGRVKLEDFGNKITFEKRIINDIGEHVLTPFKYNIPTSKKPEIEIMVSKICNYLENKDIDGLKAILIGSFRLTFTILWEGEKLSQKEEILAVG
tara:strand:- start:1772 stop:2758 length:987 start_codon:yes stop_codon:yes gene_type:complete